jgi:pyruvate,water dikinase
MSPEYILALHDPQAVLETAGGKGAALARLEGAGLPVPGGFHVTTEAYRKFVAANELQPVILAALEDVDVSQPATLERASRRIRESFDRAQIPPDVAAALIHAYTALPGSYPAVAVRSSATAEDLPEASFAGQQETYLNVGGADAVVEATRQCWASLWTARAIGYRARQGLKVEGVALAVVVQLLVPAEAAGIMFTANPLNGRRDEAVINAAWGLGEAIVGGAVTPDSITVDKPTGRVIARETADKQVMTVRVDGGTEEQPAPDSLRLVPVLSDAQAAELARHGVEIEDLFGMPMDVEWALAGGRLAILQARPITALPEEVAEAPAAWPLPNPRAMYARGSLAEHLPNPATPLFATLGLRLANQAMLVLAQEFLGAGDQTDYQYVTINGYVYLGIVFGPREVWAFTKAAIAQLGNMLGKGTERWRAARRVLEDVVAKWEAKPVERLSPSQLLAGTAEIFTETARFYTVLQSGALPTATTSETIFTRLYRGLVKRAGDPEATVFLFGFDTMPMRAEKSLFDLALWVKERAALAEYVVKTPAERLVEHLRSVEPPAGIPPEDWAGWRARFQAQVDAYGHTVYEFDFANPTPIEAPEPLLETVKMYLEGQGSHPHQRQQAAAERREQAARAVLSRLRWPLRGWFKKALKWAQDTVPVREDSLADLGMGHPQIRRLLGELGRRFMAGGAIEKAEDIYWLVEEEVNQLVVALERGEALPELSERIPTRKAEWRAQLKIVPPAILPETSRWARLVPWARQNQGDQAVIQGLGASPGKITAPACVLFSPEDFGKMKPGAVLVAVTTTPAWTPLFAMASAVVTDIGGPLSHSSIVAREYGIPAVMATGVATRRIRSGQMVTVDGGRGMVEIQGMAEDK